MYQDTTRAVRDRYMVDQLGTMSNAKILTLCFDRLDSDLESARTAIERNDHFTTNDQLGHAQDLLGELATMLDVQAWEHAGSLLSIYDYLLRLLAVANIEKQVSLVIEAQRLVSEIGDAFRAAAIESGRVPDSSPAASDVPAAPGDAPSAAPPQRFSVRA